MTSERAVAKRQEADKRRAPSEAVSNSTDSPNLSAVPDISRMSQSDILALQRQIGNQAVMRLLKQQSAAQNTQKLPDQLGGALGKAFGSDLSGVNVHTDASANQIAHSANADATTIGQDIYFGEGAFNPGTAQGNALIARQIAHVEHGRASGDAANYSSSEASAAERRDADNVGGIVETMGANPAQVLQRAHKEPTRIQKQVLQRVEGEYSHARSFGAASSKIVQGVFTTILGPLSLLWRWPIIQKNMGEALGDDIGTFKGKADDKMRYGGGKLGEAMRFMAIYAEILKELLIWCGFASLIAAIVAGATHGALTPVFLAIAIITAMIGGVLAAFKFTLVGLNAYRLFKTREEPLSKTKRAHIKAQMMNDLMDGVSALLTTIFAALGAGGVTATIGGAAAKDMGFTDGAAKGVGAGINMATQGLVTSATTNTFKESGKEWAKPGKEHGFSGSSTGMLNDKKTEDKGGFGKDAVVIKNAYKPILKSVGNFFSGKKSADDTAGTIPPLPLSQDGQKAVTDIAFVADALQVRQGEQQQDNKAANKALKTLDDNSGKAIQSADDVKSIEQDIADTGKKATAADANFDALVSVKDESDADKQESEINKGLEQIGEVKIESKKKPNIFSRIGSWFAKKARGIANGARRLWNWFMRGIIRFAGRFNNSDVDPNSVALAMKEEKTSVVDTVSTEQGNSATVAEIGQKIGDAQAGIGDLANKEAEQQ